METLEIDTRIAALYGDVDWRVSSGLVHVAAIASPSNRVIALGPSAPGSLIDRFALGLARARADAIVTTGSILRSEPDLVHCYSDDPAEDRALADWRRRVLGRSSPPSLVVLSASGVFPIDHPALRAARSGFVWSSETGRERLRGTSLVLAVEVASGGTRGLRTGTEETESSAQRSDLAAALECAKTELAATTILIEAGPSTASRLYSVNPGHSPRVDELLLSNFEGELAPSAVGPPFIEPSVLSTLFATPRSSCRIEEPSGFWRFERMRSATCD